jgi:tyrosyl-tRNA synthetase
MKRDQMTVDEELALFCKGAAEVIDEKLLRELIVSARKDNRPLKIKLGADPSAPDIHLGHSVVIWKLAELQNIGHEVIFLIGDFTGRIGDPTGKSETRKPLTTEEVLANAETYKDQIFKILNPEKTRIVFNSEWLSPLTFEDVIKLASKYTVARMLERDDFQNRYTQGKPIGVHEFFYPLAQGYDSVALGADVELGGTDQKFNLLVGRDLQRAHGQVPQICLLMPLLEGTDGVKKMSKSLHNYIGINESPEEIFGKIMSVSDEMMFKYYLLLTSKTDEDVKKMQEAVSDGTLHPMEAKKQLGVTIVDTYHGEGAGIIARQEFENIFAKKEVPTDLPEVTFSYLAENIEGFEPGLQISAYRLFAVVFSMSGGEAKRLIKGGGARVDKEKILNFEDMLIPFDGVIIQAGKRRFCKLVQA